MYCMMRFIILYLCFVVALPAAAQYAAKEVPAGSPASLIQQFYQKKVKDATSQNATFQDRYNAVAFWAYPRTFWEDVVPGLAPFQLPGNFFMFNLLGTYDSLKSQKAQPVEKMANEMVLKIVANPRRVEVSRNLPFPVKNSPWFAAFSLSSMYIQLEDYAAKVNEIKTICNNLKKYAALPEKERAFMMKGYENFDCSVAQENVDPAVFSKRQNEIVNFVRAYTRLSNGFIRSTLVPLQTDSIPGADVEKYLNERLSLRNAPKGLTKQMLKDSLLAEIEFPGYYYEQAEKMDPSLQDQLVAVWKTVSFQGSMETAGTALSMLDYLSPGLAIAKFNEYGKMPSREEVVDTVAGRLAAAALNRSIAQITNDLFEFEKPFYYSYVSMRGVEKEIGKNWYDIAMNQNFGGYMVAQEAADNLLRSGRREYQTQELSAMLTKRRISKNAEFYKKTMPITLDLFSGIGITEMVTPLVSSKRLSQLMAKWNIKDKVKQGAAALTGKKPASSSASFSQKAAASSASKKAVSAATSRVTGAAPSKPAATARPAAQHTVLPEEAAGPVKAGTAAATPKNPSIQAGKTTSQLQSEMFPKPMGKAYNSRSLTPRAPKNGGSGAIKYRNDGLVYIEEHPTDPTKAVFYYADDMGRVNTAKEMPMDAYDGLMGQMSQADKDMLGRIAQSYESEINALRVDREYDRLTDLAKEITRLQDMRQEIAAGNTYHFTEGGNFARIKKIDDEIARLNREAERTIRDMSRNGLGKEDSLRDMFKWKQGHAVERKAAAQGTLKYKDRSLMPEVKGEVPRGVFDVRADGLVYMEADATDPAKAIFYYVDDKGKLVTREMPMDEYKAFVKGLKDKDKVVLQQSARAYQPEINALRKEREYDRLTDLERSIEQKKSYANYLRSNRSGSAEDHKQIKALEDEIKALEREAERTMTDMVDNQLGTQGGIREYWRNIQGSPVKRPAQRARLVVSDDVDEAYQQLGDIGKRIEALEAQRAQITRSGEVTPQKLAQVKSIDEELKFLRAEESSGILQMEKKGMGNRRTIRQTLENGKTNPNYSIID